MSKIKKFKLQLFIILIFLVPQALDYRLYFLFISFIALVFFFSKKIAKSNSFLLIPFTLFFLVFLSTFFRFFTVVPSNLKDITEVGRLFLPCYLILMSYSFKGIKYKHLLGALIIVVSIDFVVSLMEFFYMQTASTSIYQIIKKNYWSENHWVSPYRTKGLTPGPGQHAIFGVFMFVIFYTYYLFNKHSKQKLHLLIVLMCAFIVVSSLSRTGVVCLILTFIIISTLYLKRMKKTEVLSFFSLLFVIIAGAIYFINNSQDKLIRISKITSEGLNNSSFRARIDIWEGLLETALENNSEYLLLGWGKYYFGEAAHQTDNEYVFIFLFYGLLFFVVFFIFIFKYLINFILSSREKIVSEVSVFVLIITGLIFAVPSAFFFYIPNLIMFTMLFILINKEKALQKINK